MTLPPFEDRGRRAEELYREIDKLISLFYDLPESEARVLVLEEITAKMRQIAALRQDESESQADVDQKSGFGGLWFIATVMLLWGGMAESYILISLGVVATLYTVVAQSGLTTPRNVAYRRTTTDGRRTHAEASPYGPYTGVDYPPHSRGEESDLSGRRGRGRLFLGSKSPDAARKKSPGTPYS